MGRKADEIKEELARRSLERKENHPEVAEVEDVETGEVQELETEMLTDLDGDLSEEAGEYEIVEDFEHLIAEAHEEGFASYFDGDAMAENPYLLYEVEDEDVKNLYVEAWTEGWVSAHTEGCIADVILSARKLVKATNEEEGTAMFARLEESLDALNEVSNLDEMEEAWTE